MVHLIAIGGYIQSHLIGIALAILASYVIGFVWHGPLFGKQWMKLNKIPMPKKEDIKFSMMIPGLAANFVLIFVQSAVLGRTFQLVSLANVWQALLIGTILWLPFTALTLLNINTWANRKPMVTIFDATHALIVTWVISAILYATL